MSDKSTIEWTDATWNPVRGCTKVSPGCKHCYAERFAERFRGVPGHPFTQGFDLRLVPELLDVPLRWQRPRRIFVNSMSDLFHEGVPSRFIDRVWAAMLLSPQHTFQVLTKRADRMRQYLDHQGLDAEQLYERVLREADVYRAERPLLMSVGISNPSTFPAKWIWLGVSAEDQKRADERIPHLISCPAAVRFVSAEPLLGPLDLSQWLSGSRTFHVSLSVEGALRNRSFDGLVDDDGKPIPRAKVKEELRAASLAGVKLIKSSGCDNFDPDKGCRGHREPGLDWVIIGGESGPGARPMDLDWVRDIREQCRRAGVACFVKQLGRVWAREHLADPKGGDMSRWPEDLRVREMPEVRA